MSARCKSCNAPIIWAHTHRGNRMPVDEKPVRGGNVALTWFSANGQRDAHAVVLARDAAASITKPLYTSHFATCPKADKHRTRGQSAMVTGDLFSGGKPDA